MAWFGRFTRRSRDVFDSVAESLVAHIPSELGRRLRFWFYRNRVKHIEWPVFIDIGARIVNPGFVSIGKNTWIQSYAMIVGGPPKHGIDALERKHNSAFLHGDGEVVLGENCEIGCFAILQGHGGIQLGANVAITAGCRVYSLSNHYRAFGGSSGQRIRFSAQAPLQSQALISGPVVFGDDSALGMNSVVLPGSTVGEGSIVGALSLVRGAIPPMSIAGGNPAVVIKAREA